MTTTDAKALLNSNGRSVMREDKKKRAAEDKSLEGTSSKKAAAPASPPRHAHADGREPDDAPPTTTELQEPPPQGVSWSYHSSQIGESNKYQSNSSAGVRRNFQELLLGDRAVYRDHFQMVSRMNPAIAGAIRDHTASRLTCPGTNVRAPCSVTRITRALRTRRRRPPRKVWRASPGSGESARGRTHGKAAESREGGRGIKTDPSAFNLPLGDFAPGSLSPLFLLDKTRGLGLGNTFFRAPIYQ